ncbi:MAG: prolipoprotein diacylglyceryl transferase [Actinobacteria bacterium]|nr:prolipoprotein diacylglyceryl transferase [Actinomycetota bacterium]
MYPILFRIGSFPVRSYGVMIMFGILLGGLAAYYRARKRGSYAGHVLEFAPVAAIAGILGARIWEIIFSWNNFAGSPAEMPAIWHGGLSIQGGIAGGIIAGVWYARRNRLPLWEFADILAPGIILGQAIGRIGCFLTGDCYGIPTNSIFGVVYPPGTIAYAAHGSHAIYPTVLFEAAWDLVVFGLLFLLERWNPRSRAGTTFLAYLGLYSAGRFFVEYLRDDSLLIAGVLRTAQVASIVGVLAAILLYAYLSRRSPARG